MTDTTDIAALRNKFGTKLPTADDAKEKFIELLNGPHASSWFLSPYVVALLDAFEAERQRADKAQADMQFECDAHIETAESWREWKLRAITAEAEIAALKGDLVPVGEIVAWNHPNEERKVDFRFLRFDVQPGTKLYAIEPAPAVKSDLLTRAQALAVETRALSSRIQAGE